jgi:hypothetical protein
MTRDYFLECQTTLSADLAEITNILNFIVSCTRIYAKSGPIISRVADDAELRLLLEAFRSHSPQNLFLLHQSLYVQAWSVFELFMRQLLIAYFEEFGLRKKDFATYEKFGFAQRNLKHTGIALQHILDNRTNLPIDFYAYARNAATSVPGSASVILNTEAFTIFMSGPTPDGIREAFNRIGIDLKWDQLGRIPDVQRALKAKGTRETSKLIEEFLRTAAKRRNSIVHKGPSQEAITESDVSEMIDVFGALATGLIGIAKQDCANRCL